MKNFFLVMVLWFTAFVAQAGSTNFTYYVNDALGSPVVAMNQAGDVIWRKSYAPYGKASGKDQDNRVGYTGHVEDQNGLVYAGARYYDPALGIFTSDDPVRFNESNPMSFNRYAYANNNPYKYVDPDGRDAVVGGVSFSYGIMPNSGVDQKTADGISHLYLSAAAASTVVAGGALLAGASSVAVSETAIGPLMFSNESMTAGIIAENSYLSGSTLVMENFTIAATEGRGLVSAGKQMLDYANKVGAESIRAEGTFSSGQVAARYGKQVGDAFSKTFNASKEGLKDAIKSFKE